MQWHPAPGQLVASGLRKQVLLETDALRAALVDMPPGTEIGLHAHGESDELFVVISGCPIFTAGGHERASVAGDAVAFAPGEEHSVCAGSGPARLFVVVAPNRDDLVLPDDDA